ncbi:MAG TPA: type II secretion system protein, partial [Aliidiomarina sp.]|nr:type II secretion system protein [Aliidiomarina sp.]
MSKNLSLQGAGFTLLELMIVLSLLSVLGAMGVNSLLQWQWRTHYLKTLNQIVAAVQHAQQSAQRGHYDYWLSIEPQCMWLHTQAVAECEQHAVVLQHPDIHWQANFTHG